MKVKPAAAIYIKIRKVFSSELTYLINDAREIVNVSCRRDV